MKRIKFFIDVDDWVFPISINLKLVGNDHRPYCLLISFLCFTLNIGIDEDSY